MTALPSLDTCGLSGTGLSVWHTLLQAENTALEDPCCKYNDSLIGIRLLGFFLKDFWDHAQYGYLLGSAPYSRILTEITSCLDKPNDKAIYDALVDLGLLYRNHLLRVFRANTGSRSTPSRNVSRPSFDVVKERILEELGNIPQTKPGIRNLALLRDGYRCAITGVHDWDSYNNIADLAVAFPNSTARDTEVAHIFSESAQDGDKDYAATVFAILAMFGLEANAQALYGGEVNSLRNVITMEPTLHRLFDSFDMWLEPVPGQENTYKVCGNNLRAYSASLPSSVITFSVEPSAAATAQVKNKILDLPDPVLIAIRAACARVANLSGAAEQADRILRDMEDTMVLADDGSMAELLFSRLSTLTTRCVDVYG